MNKETLQFKWTTSRGKDSYGYNICSLWIGRHKVASCNGGGYDMQGTAFGEWIQDNFQDRLKKIDAEKYYGLKFYSKDYKSHQTYQTDDKISLDGACGFSSMEKIAKAIGIKIDYITGNKNNTVYTAEWE